MDAMLRMPTMTLASSATSRLRSATGAGSRFIAGYAAENKAVLILTAIALATRLPLLSISLDEGDSANFYNALKHGYDITHNRPHAPGYPVYVFMGWLVDSVLRSPLLSLTLLSALLGSLAVVPFYLLSRDIAGSAVAFVGSLLFIVNPLMWSFSETALSDAPSMFFVTLLAWLVYRARQGDAAFLSACVVASLAVGVRQQNIAILLLLAFPVAYRLLVTRSFSWRVPLLGAVLFIVTSLAWFAPAVFAGSGGLEQYLRDVSQQWSASSYTDVVHMGPPWLPNVLYRIERFTLAYLVTYPWTGSDDKTPVSLLLAAPWLFGFALFVVGLRPRDPAHSFLALWLASLVYPVLAIHFLSRYGLPQLPAFIIACMLGYRYLALELVRHPRRFEVVSLVAIGTVMLMYGIKYQKPVGAFEASPPDVSYYVGAFIAMGAAALVVSWRLVARGRLPQRSARKTDTNAFSTAPAVALAVLALLVVPYSIRGYTLASIAHSSSSPSQRLVEYAAANFDIRSVTSCLGLQTRFIFGASTPGGAPLDVLSVEELRGAYETGKTLLLSDKCQSHDELADTIRLDEVAQFHGASPLWSKAPSLRLLTATKAPQQP